MSESPATPQRRVRTTWQNWWMVAMVAESKPASASVSRVRRTSSSSAVPVSRVGDHLVLGGQVGLVKAAGGISDLAAHPVPQLPARLNVISSISSSRAGTFGDVAGHQSGQGERLTGAGAGFQHGGWSSVRAAFEQVKRAGVAAISGLPARPAASEARAARRRRPAGCPHRRSPSS